MTINKLIERAFNSSVVVYERHPEVHSNLPFEVLYLQVLVSFLGPDAYETYEDLVIPYLEKLDSEKK